MAPANSDQSPREAWQNIRGDGDIQYAPVEFPPPDPPPEWLRSIREFFDNLFTAIGEFMAPIAQFFGSWWPIAKWVLLALAVLGLLYMIWRIAEPLLGLKRHTTAALEPEEWLPDQDQAVALLEEADALAAVGKYDEATHLLLQRSVHHIASARPDWLDPSSTAREIALIPALSETARGAFSAISTRVESSLFGMRALNGDDWSAAREAYSNFALTDLAKAGEAAA